MDLAAANQIREAHDDATADCEGLVGRVVALFIGCTGSGKSTICKYMMGTKFRAENVPHKDDPNEEMLQLVPASNELDRFVADCQAVDVTKKNVWAQIPSTDLVIVDSPGTGAALSEGDGKESGLVAEIQGTIQRKVVLQRARSLRVVLVIERNRIGTQRSKDIMDDLNYMASLFHDLDKNLHSVGFIITSSPRDLVENSRKKLVAQTIKEFSDAMLLCKEAHNKPDGLVTATKGGLKLIKHLSEHLSTMRRAIGRLESEEDMHAVEEIAKGGREGPWQVFPINVLEESQRTSLRSWLKTLPDIASSDLNSNLPRQGAMALRGKVDATVKNIMYRINRYGQGWASQSSSSQDDLGKDIAACVSLLEIYKTHSLLEDVDSYLLPLTTAVCSQNECCIKEMFSAIQNGSVQKFKRTWAELKSMEQAALDCPMLAQQKSWKGTERAKEECMTHFQERLTHLLNGGIKCVQWNQTIANDVADLLQTMAVIEPLGLEFVRSWASELQGHLNNLVREVIDSPQKAVEAIRRLQEHEILSHRLTNVLQNLNCEALGLEANVTSAKANLQAQLKNMSEKVIEEQRHGRQADCLEELRSFCTSSQVQQIFDGENLEDMFLLAPLAKCSISQDQVVAMENNMQELMDTDCEDWIYDLEPMVEILKKWEDLGPERMLKSAGVSLSGITGKLVTRIKKLHQNVMHEWSAFSLESLQNSSDIKRKWPSKFIHNINELYSLKQFDWFIMIFGDQSTLATGAEKTLLLFANKCGNELKYLTEAAQEAMEANYNVTEMLQPENFAILTCLSRFIELSAILEQGLTGSRKDKLLHETKSAKNLVEKVVTEELDTWKNMATSRLFVRNWQESYAKQIKQAEKMLSLTLGPKKQEVDAARKRMAQEIKQWHEEKCLCRFVFSIIAPMTVMTPDLFNEGMIKKLYL